MSERPVSNPRDLNADLPVHADSATNEVKQAFEKNVDLGKKFDPAVADFYSDNAVIKNTRRYPDGQSRDLSLSGKAYKDLIRASMPVANERGDISTYSEVSYKEEDGKVRITATRYSELKKYSSPISLLVAKTDGKWLIVEEVSESKP